VEQSSGTKNLLVLEDEAVISGICNRVLSKEGFSVILAVDGRKAVKLLAENKIDFCLLDIRTPGIDGLELYKHIRQKYPQLALKVIFMTGDSLSRNIPEFVNNVGCQLLEKPFTTEELLAAVRNVQAGLADLLPSHRDGSLPPSQGGIKGE
jgi:DNA-binding response OmpR family regulator